jgi:dihydrolipoamide dehydrogenase
VELARVGMDDETAEDEGWEPAVGFAAFETSPRALGQGDAEGHVRLLADMDEGTLLGTEIVGDEAAELIHLAALAPDPDSALRLLAGGPWNHPTRGEELGNAAETMAAQWGMGEFVFPED